MFAFGLGPSMSHTKAAFLGLLLTALWMFALCYFLGPSMSLAKAASLGMLLTALRIFALGLGPSMSQT